MKIHKVKQPVQHKPINTDAWLMPEQKPVTEQKLEPERFMESRIWITPDKAAVRVPGTDKFKYGGRLLTYQQVINLIAGA